MNQISADNKCEKPAYVDESRDIDSARRKM